VKRRRPTSRWRKARSLASAVVESQVVAPAPARAAAAGVEGNSRLTASAAVVLLVLLAAEGATLVAIHALVKPHVFLGFALIPPVALKAGSTIYRFARYYGGNPGYRRKGPPHILLRVLGPAVIALTVLLLGSGVALGTTHGNLQQSVLFVHKASFVLWFGAMTMHVLGHVLETLRVGPRDWTAGTAAAPRVTGAALRRWSVAGSVVAGLALGTWGLAALGPWSGHLSH
jgi:hypothetical protein